ncbi:winged helix-turn-helix transcriptional regulator [Allorhizobium taibaishanense]|uniref:HxlR family transcriptional regulator n=1 Tax=Allorhizobium taibaishanense TaxID=887144 RepID=A0A1Q9A030_9HYPH|nr:helix-turn-helix domain-containing protein [Allorhizobium taibaishanense]MBB4010532.1 DNA-binding HxlR family transcriptional regulator [Allorhizobium taibaishanense]OLP47930.1 HxlR family transcriptional regulator [Allorhizobium taibaishanense]
MPVLDEALSAKANSSRRPKAVSTEALLDVEKARPVLEQIANKWSVLILTVLCSRPSRFNEIMRRLDGITHKALSDALKRLERNGLIRREVLTTTTPVGVEYTITPLGRSLQQPFEALYAWSMTYGPELEAAQQEYDRVRD